MSPSLCTEEPALEIVPFVLGPLENNTYLLADPATGQAAVIDPSFESQPVLEEIQRRGWTLTAVWLTHAHFDHFAGANALASAFQPRLPVALHPNDLDLFKIRGGADYFGVHFESGPAPDTPLKHGQVLTLGTETVEIRHAPGHSAGHVMFYVPSAAALFCGDVLFRGSIGRTDLPGGSYAVLLSSIRTQILSLPPETILYPGHGPASTVGEERESNPFLV